MKFLNKNTIKLDKELNELDNLTIGFTSILDKLKIKYTIISGYVAVVLGRNRASEDIDIFLEHLDEEKFNNLWQETLNNFECINSEDPKEIYYEFLKAGSSVRFAKRGYFIPNIELKFPKTELDRWGIKNRKAIILNGNKLFISPLESQIPFKLFLGSEKDIEDARYLYNLSKDHLNMPLLIEFVRKLNIEELYKKYLR